MQERVDATVRGRGFCTSEIRKMIRTVLFALAFAAASITASAVTVSFDTTATWNCNGLSGCSVNGNALTINNLIMTYTPNSATVDTPSGANFGQLKASCSPTGDCSGLTSIANAQITLNIQQTGPFAGMTSFLGVLGGSISNDQSSGPATVSFSPLSGSISNGTGTTITYVLQQPTGGYILNSIQDVATSLQGTVNADSPTPEPSTVALIGLGLAVIGYRRRNA